MPSTATSQVQEILSHYRGQNPGVLTNLARLLNAGRLGGTGKLVILPVDQGFEHGPARAFGPNDAAYDPRYHVELALEAGCNAYAAPPRLHRGRRRRLRRRDPPHPQAQQPDVLQDEKDPLGGRTSSVHDALRLGCAAVGFTIYPGTADRRLQYEEFAGLAEEAKAHGLAVVLWPTPAAAASPRRARPASM
jgi:class I fructose-bisphosphate aldolase